MHEPMPYQSQDITNLAQALIAVQRTLQPAFKDAENSYTHSSYATLNSVMDACREALLDNGIWLTQYPVPSDPGHLGLVTKLTHAESGQWQSSLAVVPLPKNDPQGLGIAMTYTRRYALSAMLGIVTEDDTDGKKALPARKRRSTKPVEPPAPAEREGDPLLACMPQLDGITYELAQTQDGRTCILAEGNTRSKKQILAQVGFRWSEQRKVWWKYAETA